MSRDELLQALRRMMPETGSLNCLGCGHEHSCSTHGCAICREAIELIEQLSAEIARRIQDEMTYPGQVKITVIRETRSVSFAK